MKAFIYQVPEEVPENNGIGRVIHAQYRHLPKQGIELVRDPARADVIALHTQQWDFPRVDVLFVHGLYWTGDPKSGIYHPWHYRANEEIIKAARRAERITVPSSWVAKCFQRDMRIDPDVVGHGIDIEDWSIGQPQPYLLWNKNRAGDVCDPTPTLMLAERGLPVTTTFAPAGYYALANLRVTGALSAAEMKPLIQNAGAYLATVKETFGIGTLEAMACGVPVLGWKHGGTLDIVRDGIDGILVEPGDYDGLVKGYDAIMRHRDEFSKNARARAEEYTWDKAAKKYAEVFEKAREQRVRRKGKVSIVVTNYNYGEYIGESVGSALAQTVPTEVIVVDDGSTDDSVAKIRHMPVKLIEQKNQGVAAARTAGIKAATGDYIICLDADDRLHPQYVETLKPAFDQDKSLGIAYTGLGLITDRGDVRPNEWPPSFSWELMATPANPPSSCIPSAAMFRKEMWERVGPHRQKYAPAEDTEFWVRGLSSGFTSKKVVDDFLIQYRPHAGSASRTKKYSPIDFWFPWMRDKEFTMASPSIRVPNIRSYSAPRVSVVIPVGRGHAKYLPDAIESLLGQVMRDWEAVVVINSESPVEVYKYLYPKYPFVRTILQAGSVARARNAGAEASIAPLIVYLDADDFLMPDALQKMLQTYSSVPTKYVYSDWVFVDGEKMEYTESREYDAKAALKGILHPITALISKEDVLRVKFDENLKVLEDYDFFAKCATMGIWGQRVREGLVFIRRSTGLLKAEKKKALESGVEEIRARYIDYLEDKKPMACCGGGSVAASVASNFSDAMPASPDSGLVRMVFLGEQKGAISYGGPGITPSGRAYRGGNNVFEKYINAAPEDVQWLLGLGMWGLVQTPVAKPEAVAPTNNLKNIILPEELAAIENKATEETVPVEETKPVKKGKKSGKSATDSNTTT